MQLLKQKYGVKNQKARERDTEKVIYYINYMFVSSLGIRKLFFIKLIFSQPNKGKFSSSLLEHILFSILFSCISEFINLSIEIKIMLNVKI